MDILSADGSAGHAIGFDDAVCDELGLLKERDRDLVNGYAVAPVCRHEAGACIALSIVGDSSRSRGSLSSGATTPPSASTCTRRTRTPMLDDEAHGARQTPDSEQSRASSTCDGRVPACAGDSRRRIPVSGARVESSAVDPAREMIVGLHDWQACVVAPDDLPPRAGECVIGFDLGGSSSMTCCRALCGRERAGRRLGSVRR